MILLVICTLVLFVLAVFALASVVTTRAKYTGKLVAKQAEHDAVKKVGKWFESRVEELENENRQLAEQLVASGAVRHLAMPIPPADTGDEYAFDDTGLVRERLDPRDVPFGQ